jgi:hypothetical protein
MGYTGDPDLVPSWFVPATGKVNVNVLEAAQRCHKIAQALLDMRDELAGVDIKGKDRDHLRAALKAQAASWEARGKAWTAPAPPDDANAVVDGIKAHQVTCFEESQHVTDYLKLNEDFNF